MTDTYNYVIRKITPAGVVSTVAGTPGVAGYLDGPGPAAKFALPQGIAIDAGGNLYVADNLNRDVRMVTPAGVVSTYAGIFHAPTGVAADAAGNVYVTDHTGVFEIDLSGHLPHQLATLTNATAIAVAPDGTMYVTAIASANKARCTQGTRGERLHRAGDGLFLSSARPHSGGGRQSLRVRSQ